MKVSGNINNINADVPPLEDMTEVLKQVNAVREAREGVSVHRDTAPERPQNAKDRAKVVKRIAVSSPNCTNDTESATKVTEKASEQSPSSILGTTEIASTPSSSVDKKTTNTTGLFGGMKKGFLFGGPPKVPSLAKAKVSNVSDSYQKKGTSPPVAEISSSKLDKTESMPYIKPKGTSESALTFDEVQQAISESKGLLENQDWITDDFLSKIENNEVLLKRFADPKFMQALQEFQTNPQAAMEKYKGNHEVEKFLLEFCGLLGDHFSSLGSGTGTSGNPASPQPQHASQKKVDSCKTSTAKIIEINDTDGISNVTHHKPQNIGSIDESNCDNTRRDSSPSSEASFGIKELSLSNHSSSSSANKNTPQIHVRNPQEKADIDEMPAKGDAEVQKMLSDPKVMEILMDSKVMMLIQALKSDPEKAQRLIAEADSDLKDKIHFLVSRGLLQFQGH